MNKLNKKGQTQVGLFVMLFIVAIVGIALMIPVFDTQSQMTNKQAQTNQTVSTLTGYVDEDNVNESIDYSIFTQSAWKQLECPLTSVVIRSGNGSLLVADTDYTLDASGGEFSLLNTSLTMPLTTANETHVDYAACSDGYNTSAGARGIGRLPGLFMAIALMAVMFLGFRELFNN